MAKARSPYLATLQGTLKKTFTFRKQPRNPNIILSGRPVPTGYATLPQYNVRYGFRRLAQLWQNYDDYDYTPYWKISELYDISEWNAFLKVHLPMMKYNPTIYVPFAEGQGETVQDFAIYGGQGTLTNGTWTTYNQFPAVTANGVDTVCYFNRTVAPDTTFPHTLFAVAEFDPTDARFQALITSFNNPSDWNGYWWALYPDWITYYACDADENDMGADSDYMTLTSGLSVVAMTIGLDTCTSYYNGNVECYPWYNNLSSVYANTYYLMRTGDGHFPALGNFMIASVIPGALSLAEIQALDRHYRHFYNLLK